MERKWLNICLTKTSNIGIHGKGFFLFWNLQQWYGLCSRTSYQTHEEKKRKILSQELLFDSMPEISRRLAQQERKKKKYFRE